MSASVGRPLAMLRCMAASRRLTWSAVGQIPQMRASDGP